MKLQLSCVPLVLLALGNTVQAQYGRSATSPFFTPPSINGVYAHGSGILGVLLETASSADEAHLFVDDHTGQIISSLRLDMRHRTLITADHQEILVTGEDSVDVDPGAPVILQPVYFAGRYDAATLQSLAEVQLDVDRNDGYNLAGQISPDGDFVFYGANSLQNDNLVARYNTSAQLKWGASLLYHSQPTPLGLSVYPLSHGDTGIRMYYPGVPDASGTAVNQHVLAVLDGAGNAKWSAVARASASALVQEDFRFVFGPDGSLFASKETINLLSPASDSIQIVRVGTDGKPKYSKHLKLTDAVFEWQYYFGEYALLFYTFKQNGNDRLQFIVLDGNGNITGNTALNCQLRGNGQIKLTAARRQGTDYAFIRMECGIPLASPQQILARLNLKDGTIETRRLPTPVPGVETYEIATTPKGDANGHNNDASAFAAVSSTIVGTINRVGGGSRVGFYELPADGDFPSCLSLNDSAIAVGSPLTPQLSDTSIIDFEDGLVVSKRSMPGTTTPLARPTLQPTPIEQTEICPDDLATPGSVITLVPTSAGRAELQIPTMVGFRYSIERSEDFTNWSEFVAASGNGSPLLQDLELSEVKAFYRCRVTPVNP